MSARRKEDVRRARRTFLSMLVVTSAASVTACGNAADGSGRGATTTDSLGVEVVSTARPVWTEGKGWTVAEEAALTIGTALGDESQSLFDVGDVRRLSDGRIAVVNSGTRQIRIYGPDGDHVIDLGGEGDGPGEFRRPRRLWLAGSDSLVVFDGRVQRLTVFAPDLTLARTISVTNHGEARQTFAAWRFTDGRLLVEGLVPSPIRPQAGRFPGGMSSFELYSPDADYVSSVVELPRGDNWGFTGGSSGLAYTTFPFSMTYPPRAGEGDAFYIASGLVASIEQRTPEGELTKIVRWSADPVPVDESVEAQFRDWRLSLSEDENYRTSTLSMLSDMEFPEHLPLFGSMLVDSQGCLWVEPYRPYWETGRRWWIFDPEGTWLGELPLTDGFDVRDVGADYILGVHRDDDGVERVAMYPLDRSGFE